MKATKRILAMLVCVFVLVGCMSVSVYAADTASITIENQSGTNASVAGKTLNLFKVFNATVSGSNISYQWIEDDGGNNKYESFFFGTDGVVGDSGTIHDVVAYINGLEDDSFAFSQMAAKLHEYINDNNIQPEKSEVVPDGSTSYTFDGLSLGYYLIYDATVFSSDDPAVRSAAMLAHAGENKVIKLKADRPHIEKTVDDSDTATPEWRLGTTASIGEKVTFRIATMVPDHILYGDDYFFEITDKMADELELVKDSIKVTITAPAAVDNGVAPVDATYSVTTDGLSDGVDFKITFTNITDLSQSTVIEVTYDAIVKDNAAFVNTNTATLEYSNDPNDLTSTGEVDSSANVLLWQFTLTKYLEDASGTPSFMRLAGAEFEIYAKDDLDNPLKFSTTTAEHDGTTYTKYIFDPVDGTETTLATFNGGDDGKTDVGYTDGGHMGEILIFGLGEGSYVIRETKAPDGYQIAKGDFEFTLTDTVGVTGAVSNAVISEATRTEKPGQFTRVSVSESNQKFYIGITNAPGSALPETGGIGTYIFYGAGIALMAGAIAFFTSRKRSRA